MTTAMTPTPSRATALKPLGTDVVSIAAINAMAQVLLDRGEWTAKQLVDFKAVEDASDNKVLSTTAEGPNNGTLIFTDVKAGDRIVVSASVTCEMQHGSTYTPDSATYQAVELWLYIGPTTVNVGRLVTFPSIVPANVPASATGTAHLVYEAVADAATLNAEVELAALRASPTITVKAISMAGTHFRLGAT